MARIDAHILGEQQLFHLADLPFQVIFTVGGNRNQQIQEIKVLVIG